MTVELQTVYPCWADIQKAYPHQWLLFEAVEAHSTSEQHVLDKMTVIDTFASSVDAMRRYAALHHDDLFHTDRPSLDIKERRWPGIRGL